MDDQNATREALLAEIQRLRAHVAHVERRRDSLKSSDALDEECDEALRQSEALLSQAEELANLGSWEIHLDTDQVRWSAQLSRIHGLRPEDLGGPVHLMFFHLIHPDDRDRIIAGWEWLLRERQDPAPQEYRIVRPDGSVRFLYSQGRLVRDATGRPVKFIGTSQDITERKHAEATLRDSEERFRSLFDQLEIGVLMMGPRTEILMANPAAPRLLGLTMNQLLGKTALDPYWDAIREDGSVLPNTEFPVPQAIALRRQVRNFVMGVRRDDSCDRVWLLVNAGPQFADDGSVKRVLCTFADITERKRVEEALRESEERFREMAETIRDAFWITDPTARKVFYVSPAYEEIWGRSCASVQANGLSWLDAIHADDSGRVQESLRQREQSGTSDVEYRVIRPDGTIRYVHDRSFAVLDQSQSVCRIVGVATDVTARKQAEEERRQLELQVQHAQKLESLGILAGGIAHDFNNLLTAVLGYADLALQEVAAGSSVGQLIGQVENVARHAAELTQQLLAYSGKGKFVIQTVDLSTLVREMARLLRTVISKQAELQLELADGLPAIEVDVTQLRQVIMNLITNASEAYGRASGTILVRTELRAVERPAVISPYVDNRLPGGRYVCLTVTDSGCGMSEATLARIFDPFFSTKFTGRGLGLAAALGIVRGHRGFLNVSSAPGKGSTFEVYFPGTGHASDTSAEQHQDDTLSWQGSGKVLIIEDEPSIMSLLQQMLSGLGFQPVSASNGRDGLEAFQHHAGDFPVVLLDLMIPGISGVEALRKLREVRSDVRVILMSAHTEQEAVHQLSGEAVTAFLPKPFLRAELIAALRAACGC